MGERHDHHECHEHDECQREEGNWYPMIIVLFILLIIIGAYAFNDCGNNGYYDHNVGNNWC